MKKQLLALALAIALLLPMVACQKPNNTAEPIVIRLCAPQNAFIEDFETNEYKLWLEEQTGYKIEMTWLPEKEAGELARNALINGIDLPDAYVGFNTYPIFSETNLMQLGENGFIIPLDTLIEKYGENLKSVWSELSEYNVKALMTSADGHIYYMPGFSSSVITRYRQVMWLNKNWLDTLGLSVPTTTDEFRDVLYAFLTRDPNGNNINDEIPLAGTESYMGKQVYDYLFNAFIYNNEKNSRLLLENGKIGFAPIENEWREALVYMRGLYKDGLISPLSFTQDDAGMKQMATDSRDILGGFTTSGITYTVQQNSPEILSRYIGIAPLMGPDGVQLATVSIPLPKANGVITSASKHPEEVFKLFDLMLSEEACLRGRYGEQGVDWDFASEGDVSIYGTPATIDIKNQIWNTPQNKHLKQIVPYVSRPKFSGGVTWDGNVTDGEYMNAQAAMLYAPYEPKEFVGVLIFTPAEEFAIQKQRGNIEKYVNTSIADFITGKSDINKHSEWGAYIKGFDELGLSEFIAVCQIAYDRMSR